MKKNRVLFSFVVVVAAVFLFTSASTSLDGRAVVAESGDLPEGFFAKTVGYLPGDSISVTNMITRKTIDVLVIGALDASEGIAILLSKEAAMELGVVKDTNTVVKITKRSDELDKVFSGSAVVARGGTANDLNEIPTEIAPSVSDNDVFADNFVEEPADNFTDDFEENYYTGNLPPQYTYAPSENDVNEAAAEAERFAAERFIDDNDIIYNNANEKSNDKIANLVPAEKEAVYADLLDNYNYNPVHEKPVETINEEIPEEPQNAVSERFIDSYLDPEPEFLTSAPEQIDAEEEVKELAQKPVTPSERVVIDSIPAETVPAYDEKLENVASLPEEEPEQSPFEEDYMNYYISETLSDNIDNIDEQNSVISAADEVAEQSYEPIVLVPANPNPPVPEDVPVQRDIIASANSFVNPANVAASEPKNNLPSVSNNYSDSSFALSNMRSLESGKYYVQIASSDDSKAVKSVIARYGQNYPIVVVPTSSNSAMQIMVGPLTVDEYEAVMARFKSYGFNDAFLRKIK